MPWRRGASPTTGPRSPSRGVGATATAGYSAVHFGVCATDAALTGQSTAFEVCATSLIRCCQKQTSRLRALFLPHGWKYTLRACILSKIMWILWNACSDEVLQLIWTWGIPPVNLWYSQLTCLINTTTTSGVTLFTRFTSVLWLLGDANQASNICGTTEWLLCFCHH